MDKNQANQTQQHRRSFALATCIRIVWLALLFLLVAGLDMYAVASSFPLPGGSEPRSGTAAIHESAGVIIMEIIHGPLSWLYPYIDGKAVYYLIWLIWAAVLYLISTLVHFPRWVFTPTKRSDIPR